MKINNMLDKVYVYGQLTNLILAIKSWEQHQLLEGTPNRDSMVESMVIKYTVM